MTRSAILVGALVVLSSCTAGSDPATETPVDLKPGNYDVFVRGPGNFLEAANKSGRLQLCLSQFEAKEWPRHPLEKTTRKYNGCYDKVDEPRGNALSGQRNCPRGTSTFTGEHGDERFVVRGEITWKADGRKEPYTITGRRTGDC